VLLVLLLLVGNAAAAPAYAPALERLGRAYAATCGSTLAKAEAGQPRPVTAANRAGLTAQAQKALALGYVPQLGRIEAVPWREGFRVEMAGGRTPLGVLQSALAPGNVVVPVTWTFAGSPPIKSFTIFSPGGEPLFDTLIAMPIVPGPLFNPRHF
jgi:hypothetical protein